METKSMLSARAACFIYLLLSISLITCKGPAGDTGATGATGVQGIPGPAGPVGSANLIVSPWTKVPDSVWLANRDSTYFTISKDDSKITQSILDAGVLLAYYRNSGRQNVIFSLPAVNEELSLGFFAVVRDGKGSVNFDMSFDKPRKTPIDFDLEFRWIIVPAIAGGRMSHSHFNNYEMVRKELKLPD